MGILLANLEYSDGGVKDRIVVALNHRCYYHSSWQSSLFMKIKSILKKAEKIHLSGRKFHWIVIRHLHVDEVPLTTKMIEVADEIDCKGN